jgi:diguanylate cyclase (GGDEF)-like protein
LRESDIVARLGGDEFCVLFTGVSALGAGKALTRLQDAVRRRNESADGPPLALSIGLANWSPSSDETLEELIQRADRKMYANKKSKS